MSLKLRTTRITTLAVSAGIALTAFAVSGAAAPANVVKRSTTTCSPAKKEPAYLPDGNGYFTSKLILTNVSCTYGRKFIVAFWKCRTNSGKNRAGRCTRRVQGFSCTERRESIPTEIDARVTCRRGTQKIVHSYQQNLD